MQFNQPKSLSTQNHEGIISALKSFFAEKNDENFSPKNEVIQFCKKIPFFQALAYSDRHEIKEIGLDEAIYNALKIAKLEEFPLGQILYEKGQDSEKFYILLVGSVCIYKQKTQHELSTELRNKKIIDNGNIFIQQKSSDTNSLPQTFYTNNDMMKTNDRFHNRPQTSLVTEPIHRTEPSWNIGPVGADNTLKNLRQSFNRFSAGNGIIKVKIVSTIYPLSLFGTEMIYLGQQSRENMAVAVTPIKVLTFDANSYKRLLFERDLTIKKRRIFFAEYFKELNPVVVDTISQYMECIFFKQGKHVYFEGDSIDGLYFIEEGKVKLVKKTTTKGGRIKESHGKERDEFVAERIVDEMSRGQLFGEELLFSNLKERRYSAIVACPRVYVYKLDKKHFDIMCKDHENVVKKMKESCMSKIKWREKRMESLNNSSKEQILKLNDVAKNILSPVASPNEKSFFVTNSAKIKEFMIDNIQIYRQHTTLEVANSARMSQTLVDEHEVISPTNIPTLQEDVTTAKSLALNRAFFKFNPTPADLCSMPISFRSQFTTRNHSKQGHSKERKQTLLRKIAETTNRRNREHTSLPRDFFIDKKLLRSPLSSQNLSPKILFLRKQMDNRTILTQRRSTATPKNSRSQSKKDFFLSENKDQLTKPDEKEETIKLIKNNGNIMGKHQIGKLEDISQKLNDLTSYISTALRNYKTMSVRESKS